MTARGRCHAAGKAGRRYGCFMIASVQHASFWTRCDEGETGRAGLFRHSMPRLTRTGGASVQSPAADGRTAHSTSISRAIAGSAIVYARPANFFIGRRGSTATIIAIVLVYADGNRLLNAPTARARAWKNCADRGRAHEGRFNGWEHGVVPTRRRAPTEEIDLRRRVSRARGRGRCDSRQGPPSVPLSDGASTLRLCGRRICCGRPRGCT